MGQSVSISRETASGVVANFRGKSAELSVVEILATCRKGGKWFPGLAKRLSKDKPAAAVHHLTSEAERTCYDWCSGAVDPPARAIIKLLHSEVGWIVLEYLMRGCKAPWWLLVVEAREFVLAGDAARQEARKQLEFNLR